MRVDVFDTYVVRKNGQLMNFDILVPEGVSEDHVYRYGKAYLQSKGEENQSLTAIECRLCHVEQATESVAIEIQKTGYCIVELRGCE